MKKLTFLLALLATALTATAGNYILYTSTDGQVVTPFSTDAFGANIVSNTYENGQGKILFDGEVTSFGNDAFYFKSSLKTIEIPNSVTKIGDYAFSGCSSLAEVVIPNSVTKICQFAFACCSSMTKLEIPNSVTEIEECAFMDCSGLTTMVIPNSVTKIAEMAIAGCSSLTTFVIPNSVTEIGEYAFVDCDNLSALVIPNSVKKIGEYAFSNCPCLQEVTVLAEDPESITTSLDIFDCYRYDTDLILTNATLRVPLGCKAKYETTKPWSKFQNIEEFDPTPVRPILADYDDAPSYNLSGRRVGDGYKGIVVREGRKVLRK